MPAGNPLGYLPPELQVALIGLQPAGMGGPFFPPMVQGDIVDSFAEPAGQPTRRRKPHVSQFGIDELRAFRHEAVKKGQQDFANALSREIVAREQAERLAKRNL